ncbi:MAG TPA: hypothetical protein VFA75_11415 [Nevskia sp.]|nr:hypothetical protein [Nevskia sp.]
MPTLKSAFKPATFCCGLLALAFAVQADEVVMQPDAATQQAAAKPAGIPAKGQTMAQVLKRFGEPQVKHKPAGGDAPKHPPITRWDYAGFSVFFEHSHVVDTVVPGSPPPVYHTEQLKPAS